MDNSDAIEPGFLRAVRRSPGHAGELAVLYGQPQLAPRVAAAAAPTDNPEAQARQAIRRASAHARRDGAVCGSSLYVALPAAIASLYYRQLRLVLQIAALYGHDPSDPARAAEALVIQGRYADLDTAARALSDARRETTGVSATPASERGAGALAREALRVLPRVLGVRLAGWRRARPCDKLVSALVLAGYFLPIVGIPSNAISAARATRRVGRAAISFYAAGAAISADHSSYTLPPGPTRRRRARLVALEALACLLAASIAELLFTSIDGLLHDWGVIALGELLLVTTFVRMWWITRA